MTANTLQFFWQDPSVDPRFRAGVSLHSHTMCSEESLEMIPRYTAKVPYLSGAVRRHQAHFEEKGDHLDFDRAFWTPPLSPRQAHRLEEKQIHRSFQLPGLVSLTDHDSILAGTHLRVLDRFRHAPVSTEWTVPFGPTFFHIGVHNLPAGESAAIAEQLAEFSADPNPRLLPGLLSMLNSYPDVLLVLNHPLWDEKGIGSSQHNEALASLMQTHGWSLHALELNGLRSWNENKEVIALGRKSDLPLVSGGDRHGLEPNAILNLSRGRTLIDFIHDVRYARFSHVVFMPQYREPLKLRILQTMVDVVREYPENFEGRRSWADRVFYRDPKEPQPVPLSSYWKDGGPMVVKHFIGAMKLIEYRGIRSALRLALNDTASVWSDRGVAV